jgi:hypothetical protein
LKAFHRQNVVFSYLVLEISSEGALFSYVTYLILEINRIEDIFDLTLEIARIDDNFYLILEIARIEGTTTVLSTTSTCGTVGGCLVCWFVLD